MKQDPLIAALIEKLPKDAKEWAVDKQIAWLRLMAMAFGTIYGGDAAAQIFDGKAAAPAPSTPAPEPEPAEPFKPSEPFMDFHIDEEGYARRTKDGSRVMPADVTDTIIDLRGEHGDLGGIIWADDSTGVLGADLNIAA
jgi:hypothetical protein